MAKPKSKSTVMPTEHFHPKGSKSVFFSILTHEGPSSNYRGEGDGSSTTHLQRIHWRGSDHTVVSAEAIRNALRDTLRYLGLPYNRSRVENSDKPTVHFKERCNENLYADDFIFGYMLTKPDHRKRDSIIRANKAIAIAPFKFESTFHQSPHTDLEGTAECALLRHEVVSTSYQFPLAFRASDFMRAGETAVEWGKALLQAVGQLNDVAGNRARSYFEFSPKSMVVRCTTRLAAGFDYYGFRPDGTHAVVDAILRGEVDGKGFFMAGEIVSLLDKETKEALAKKDVKLIHSVEKALDDLAGELFP